MGNKSIKNAIIKHLQKSNVLDEEYYISLHKDVTELKKLRQELDDALLKHTQNKGLFFNFTEELNTFLILFERYQQHCQFISPDIEDIKETFALKDTHLCELISEMRLDVG